MRGGAGRWNDRGVAVGAGGGGGPSRLDDINPEAIERIEILKGSAAATLYGTQAANGVIQIFTKRGQAGEQRWDVGIEQGFTRYPLGRINEAIHNMKAFREIKPLVLPWAEA